MPPVNEMDIQLLRTFQRLSSVGYSLLRIYEELGDGHSLEEIVVQITADRFRLAEGCAKVAQNLLESGIVSEATYRSIISRNYYAIYQAARAIVFHVTRNDVDDHRRLSDHVGKILGPQWGKVVDRWRKARNEMDYSPYPEFDEPPLEGLPLDEVVALSFAEAEGFLDEVRKHLSKRGVK